MLSEYTYDNDGNMTGERYSEINPTGGPRIYQNAYIGYDALNRKVRVWDEDYSISYEYDENSNVRHVLANYSDDDLAIAGQQNDAIIRLPKMCGFINEKQ